MATGSSRPKNGTWASAMVTSDMATQSPSNGHLRLRCRDNTSAATSTSETQLLVYPSSANARSKTSMLPKKTMILRTKEAILKTRMSLVRRITTKMVKTATRHHTTKLSRWPLPPATCQSSGTTATTKEPATWTMRSTPTISEEAAPSNSESPPWRCFRPLSWPDPS